MYFADENVWLGLANTGSGFLSQKTQTSPNFTHWDASQPDDPVHHEAICVSIDLSKYNGSWSDRTGSHHDYAVVCEIEYVSFDF